VSKWIPKAVRNQTFRVRMRCLTSKLVLIDFCARHSQARLQEASTVSNKIETPILLYQLLLE
jgi:hypothetical protein